MLTLPIAEIVKLRPAHGEMVVVTPSREMSVEAAERLRERVERALARAGYPDTVVVILTDGASMAAAEIAAGAPLVGETGPEIEVTQLGGWTPGGDEAA